MEFPIFRVPFLNDMSITKAGLVIVIRLHYLPFFESYSERP